MKKFAIVAITIALVGCAKNPDPECNEIAKSVVNPANYWIQEIVHETKVEPQHCSMIVRAYSSTYSEGSGTYNQNQFQIEADFKLFSNGKYTYTYTVETVGHDLVPATPPSLEQALASGTEFEAAFGEDDMCFGFNEQVIKGEGVGSGQADCTLTQATKLFLEAGGTTKLY